MVFKSGEEEKFNEDKEIRLLKEFKSRGDVSKIVNSMFPKDLAIAFHVLGLILVLSKDF